MSATRKRPTAKTATSTAAAGKAAGPSAGAPAAGTRLLARVAVPVRWGDLDAFNHVNNAAFLVYAQEARLEWLAGIGGSWFDENAMPVVAAAHVNYRRQLAWPARIVVELAATRVGNSSVTITHRIVAQDDPACLYADGDVVMVWIDPASGKSVPLPDAIRTACA
jgi:acyl-CoA thioester hydrolase